MKTKMRKYVEQPLKDFRGTEIVNIVSNLLNLLFGRGEHSSAILFFERCHCCHWDSNKLQAKQGSRPAPGKAHWRQIKNKAIPDPPFPKPSEETTIFTFNKGKKPQCSLQRWFVYQAFEGIHKSICIKWHQLEAVSSKVDFDPVKKQPLRGDSTSCRVMWIQICSGMLAAATSRINKVWRYCFYRGACHFSTRLCQNSYQILSQNLCFYNNEPNLCVM